MSRPCRYEAIVVRAARDVQSPVPDDVQAHLAACDDCREVFALTASLVEERGLAVATARVPSAGQVWWRAELRARQDAAAAAARPITLATGLAAAAVMGVLASLVGGIAWWMRAEVAPLLARIAAPVATGPATWSSSAWLVVAVALAAMLVATPVVLYVASRED